MNAAPRHTQLAVGPLVAAAGAALLIVSLFLDWYEGFTGFTTFEFLDLLLLMLALSVIAALAGSLGMGRDVVPPGVALGVASFALFVVLSQVVNDPPLVIGPGRDKDLGIWLGLAGAAVMVAGTVLGFARISLAVETRPRVAREDPPSAPRPDDTDTERL